MLLIHFYEFLWYFFGTTCPFLAPCWPPLTVLVHHALLLLTIICHPFSHLWKKIKCFQCKFVHAFSLVVSFFFFTSTPALHLFPPPLPFPFFPAPSFPFPFTPFPPSPYPPFPPCFSSPLFPCSFLTLSRLPPGSTAWTSFYATLDNTHSYINITYSFLPNTYIYILVKPLQTLLGAVHLLYYDILLQVPLTPFLVCCPSIIGDHSVCDSSQSMCVCYSLLCWPGRPLGDLGTE